MLEPETRCGGAFARIFEREKCFLLPFASEHKKISGLGAIKLMQQRARLAGKLRCVNASVRGDRKSEHHSSHRGVDSRLVHEIPKHDSDQQVRPQMANPDSVESNQNQ